MPRNSQSTDVDNPDQRISEDVNYFTKVTLDFLLLVGEVALSLLMRPSYDDMIRRNVKKHLTYF